MYVVYIGVISERKLLLIWYVLYWKSKQDLNYSSVCKCHSEQVRTAKCDWAKHTLGWAVGVTTEWDLTHEQNKMLSSGPCWQQPGASLLSHTSQCFRDVFQLILKDLGASDDVAVAAQAWGWAANQPACPLTIGLPACMGSCHQPPSLPAYLS